MIDDLLEAAVESMGSSTGHWRWIVPAILVIIAIAWWYFNYAYL